MVQGTAGCPALSLRQGTLIRIPDPTQYHCWPLLQAQGGMPRPILDGKAKQPVDRRMLRHSNRKCKRGTRLALEVKLRRRRRRHSRPSGRSSLVCGTPSLRQDAFSTSPTLRIRVYHTTLHRLLRKRTRLLKMPRRRGVCWLRHRQWTGVKDGHI